MKVSYRRSGPWIGPDISRQHAPVGAELERHDDPGDDTEPERHAEDLEPELEDHADRPDARSHRCSASSTVSHAASPIVKDGKMMWNEMVKANCSRDRRSAVRSIGISSPVSCDPLGMGEHLEPVVACDAHEW